MSHIFGYIAQLGYVVRDFAAAAIWDGANPVIEAGSDR